MADAAGEFARKLFAGPCDFIWGASNIDNLPPQSLREVAFVGRSNVGKSSLINALTGRKTVARVSQTPGRTREINFFNLGGKLMLVDLPGYGYAKVPPDVKAHWEALLSEYLQTREALCGLVVIMDSRHPLTELDEQMLNWFALTGKPVHVLLTKSDKLSRQQATTTLNRVKLHLAEHYPFCSVQLFSSLKKLGTDEAEAVIAGWFEQN